MSQIFDAMLEKWKSDGTEHVSFENLSHVEHSNLIQQLLLQTRASNGAVESKMTR